MNAEQRELFRLALLRVFDTNHTRYGLGLEALKHFGLSFGLFAAKPEELEREVQYLEDKGYIVVLQKVISPENRVWRITAAGRDYLSQLSNES
jgi:hypothetical protein